MEEENKYNKLDISISFGPITKWPSSRWVGSDIADQIRLSCNVSCFKCFDENITSNTIFIIKSIPDINWILNQKKKGKKLIYLPVDKFSNIKQIVNCRFKLSMFDSIVLHNEHIRKFISPYAQQIFSVDHYLKYKLNIKRKYVDDGFILWIGHFEYLPSMVKALNDISLNYPVKVLTDLQNFAKREKTIRKKMKSMVGKCKISYKNSIVVLNGITLEQWTETKQDLYMKECKCAFDTKEDSFRHFVKPPTKSQQYIFNNIPFAISNNSYAHRWFLERGLNIPSIEDQTRWYSKEYHLEIEDFIIPEISKLSKEYIANKYIDISLNTINNKKKKLFLLKTKYYLTIIISLNIRKKVVLLFNRLFTSFQLRH